MSSIPRERHPRTLRAQRERPVAVPCSRTVPGTDTVQKLTSAPQIVSPGGAGA